MEEVEHGTKRRGVLRMCTAQAEVKVEVEVEVRFGDELGGASGGEAEVKREMISNEMYDTNIVIQRG